MTLLDEVVTDSYHWSKDIFGKVEKDSQLISKRPLAILNTAFAQSGVLIEVTGNIEVPIELIYVPKIILVV